MRREAKRQFDPCSPHDDDDDDDDKFQDIIIIITVSIIVEPEPSRLALPAPFLLNGMIVTLFKITMGRGEKKKSKAHRPKAALLPLAFWVLALASLLPMRADALLLLGKPRTASSKSRQAGESKSKVCLSSSSRKRRKNLLFLSKEDDNTEEEKVEDNMANNKEQQNQGSSSSSFEVQTWNPLRLMVLRLGLTELRATSPFNYGKYDGKFSCAYCGQTLFDSNSKYDSGSGWPSFWRTDADGSVSYKMEFDGRLECRCSRCSSHLGHVFLDGPLPAKVPQAVLKSIPSSDPRGRTADNRLPRFCINGASLRFNDRGEEGK